VIGVGQIVAMTHGDNPKLVNHIHQLVDDFWVKVVAAALQDDLNRLAVVHRRFVNTLGDQRVINIGHCHDSR